MDVGQRPSRQRRHLPSHGSAFAPSRPQQVKIASDESTDDSYKPSRGRERKQKAKKRVKTSFENLMVSRRKQDNDVIQWRQWFWRGCVLWMAFLCLRVMISIWQGDVTRLGWNQYPYRWW